VSAIAIQFKRYPRTLSAISSIALVGIIGVVDYITGFEIFFSAFYLLPVALAAWYAGGAWGIVISILSVAVSMAGDYAAGAQYSTVFVPVWNGAIVMAVYFVVVKTLTSLRKLQNELEERVRQRTAALDREMHERARLEKELLEISEREQRRIGNDLHDSLCQHLTATALAGQVLGEKLAAKSAPETADAREFVRLVEDGIALTRNLAHGISPVEMDTEGLITALQELAANISKISHIKCTFECAAPPLTVDAETTIQLYRIAQEAINNAIRHGKPKQIILCLSNWKGGVELTVEDDGIGLPDDWDKNRGLGTRIMAYRATMIGGSFSIEPNPTGGTFVKCSILTPGKISS
jgi:signal transduction histidine kinase